MSDRSEKEPFKSKGKEIMDKIKEIEGLESVDIRYSPTLVNLNFCLFHKKINIDQKFEIKRLFVESVDISWNRNNGTIISVPIPKYRVDENNLKITMAGFWEKAIEEMKERKDRKDRNRDEVFLDTKIE